MRIDVAFCVNDGFAPYIGVCIKSICSHHKDVVYDVHIHVLTDYISEKNTSRLKEIVAKYPNVHLKIYTVDDSRLRNLKATWSIYTWYRVLLPSILPADVHRVLYLDADTLVLGNLSELFRLDMTDHPIAASIDIESFNADTRKRCGFSDHDIYICAGVMLMNLDYWREHDLADKAVQWGLNNDALIKFPDQDTINVLCKDTKIVLPIKYGIQEIFYKYEHMRIEEYREQLIESIEDAKIIHYAGCAPWIKEFSNHMFHCDWLKYNNLLCKPITLKYQTQGLNKYKVMIWNLLHRKEIKAKRLHPINVKNELKHLSN